MKIFLIQPRQTGKTTKAVYEFLKDPDNTLFITHKIEVSKHIKDLIGFNHKNVISAKQFLNKKGVHKVKSIILDEYLFFENKEDVYKEVYGSGFENIYVFSTSNKIYDKRLFNNIKRYKKDYSYEHMVDLHKSNFSRQEVYELYYNFLTDSDFKIIDTYKHTKDRQDLIHILGEESYRTEVLNNYLVG
jgi:hypothetical protein